MLCLGIFVINSIRIIYKDNKEINTVNFNILFSLSFFFCSFSFACFVLPTGDFGLIGSVLSESSINPCTALCTCAFNAYALGYTKTLKKKKVDAEYSKEYLPVIVRKSEKIYLFLFMVVILVLIFFFRTKHDVEIEVTSSPYLFVLFTIFTAILFASVKYRQYTTKSLINFCQSNKIVVCGTLLIMLIYVIIGDRKLIIDLGLILLGAYSLFYKRISAKCLAVILSMGFVLMILIGLTRNSSSSLREGGIGSFVTEGSSQMQDKTSIWGMFSDLTERYEELYCGYEYTQKHGLQYPLKIISLALSPIPLLPNVICHVVYGIPLADTSPGNTIGKNMFMDRETSAGSHCVVDTLMPWGLTGTLIVFYVFGIVVRFVSINYRRNLLFSSIYLLLLSQSFFLARGSLFDIYRLVAWCYFSIYFVKNKSNYRIK